MMLPVGRRCCIVEVSSFRLGLVKLHDADRFRFRDPTIFSFGLLMVTRHIIDYIIIIIIIVINYLARLRFFVFVE